ncbi:MAG: glycosyltransferase family A protein [Burkholderiaceae bacterium]
MIAVVVPAHNEQDLIASCLRSLDAATHTPLLHGEPTLVVVALDACTDGTEAIARQRGVALVKVNSRNVGVARSAGAALALRAGARWLAFTDADSVVAPDWLAAQLSLDADAVCGTIGVLDWSPFGARMRKHFDATYTDADGHRHIHGANLGVRAAAYEQVGGFLPLDSSEDVALVRALERSGASIAWSAAPRVLTSARRAARAPRGFGATLLSVEARGYRSPQMLNA